MNDILTRYNTLATSLELIHPDDREKVLANSAEFAKQKKGYDIKYRIVRPDGVERHVREIVDPIVNHQWRA